MVFDLGQTSTESPAVIAKAVPEAVRSYRNAHQSAAPQGGNPESARGGTGINRSQEKRKCYEYRLPGYAAHVCLDEAERSRAESLGSKTTVSILPLETFRKLVAAIYLCNTMSTALVRQGQGGRP